MTIQQLKYISMVEKYGSITKAAQKLYVSQPSVSAAIHGLEEELGIEIFIRTAKGIVLTEDGRELLKMGNKILHDVEHINERFAGADSEEGVRFNVCSQHYDFVAEAFEECVREFDTEKYSLGLSYGQTASILEAVQKQYSDLGVIFLSDANRHHMEKALEERHLEFHSLARTKPHVFIRKDHPLAEKSSIRTGDLMEYPCIYFEQDLNDPGFFSEEMMIAGFYPEKILYINDLNSSIRLIRNCNAYDIGTGIMGRELSEHVTVIPVETMDTVEVGWIELKGKAISRNGQLFIKCLEKYIREGLMRQEP